MGSDRGRNYHRAAALETNFPLIQMADHPDELLQLLPDVALRRIAHGYLAIFHRAEFRRGLRLMIGELVREDSELRDTVIGAAISRVLGLLSTYFRAQMETGTMGSDRGRNYHRAAANGGDALL